MQVQIFKFLNHFNSFTFYRNVENKQCLSRKDFVCLIGIFCLLNRNHRSLGILGLLTHIYTTPTHTQTHKHTHVLNPSHRKERKTKERKTKQNKHLPVVTNTNTYMWKGVRGLSHSLPIHMDDVFACKINFKPNKKQKKKE